MSKIELWCLCQTMFSVEDTDTSAECPGCGNLYVRTQKPQRNALRNPLIIWEKANGLHRFHCNKTGENLFRSCRNDDVKDFLSSLQEETGNEWTAVPWFIFDRKEVLR